MLLAHESHRSACFDVRRASAYVTRRTAPFSSSTSLPHLSHTRIVLRAKVFSPFLVGKSRQKCTRNSRGLSRLPNAPRPKQAEHRRFFRGESEIARLHDTQMTGPEILDRPPLEILLDDGGRHVRGATDSRRIAELLRNEPHDRGDLPLLRRL